MLMAFLAFFKQSCAYLYKLVRRITWRIPFSVKFHPATQRGDYTFCALVPFALSDRCCFVMQQCDVFQVRIRNKSSYLNLLREYAEFLCLIYVGTFRLLKASTGFTVQSSPKNTQSLHVKNGQYKASFRLIQKLCIIKHYQCQGNACIQRTKIS